jgi:selenocysteine lyase/cysteine desulfurase
MTCAGGEKLGAVWLETDDQWFYSARCLTSLRRITLAVARHQTAYSHRAIGTFPDGAVRVSPGPFNTAEDIDTLADALAEIKL